MLIIQSLLHYEYLSLKSRLEICRTLPFANKLQPRTDLKFGVVLVDRRRLGGALKPFSPVLKSASFCLLQPN